MSQSPVNIVYPISGAHYPITDPACKVASAYVTASFGSTCPGGPNGIKWGFDGMTLCSGEFYDEFSAQFTWKLPAGPHIFWVAASCGEYKVEFTVGP